MMLKNIEDASENSESKIDDSPTSLIGDSTSKSPETKQTSSKNVTRTLIEKDFTS